ncbi:MAG TPA: acyl carrier protein [Gemmatimonadaceae bacterium]|nr:acyl carrier protein [Gemmatimonadaceae bacterium]
MNADVQAYVERRTDALERVRRMLVETLELPRETDEIDPDVALFGSGLGLDSVDAVDLVVQLETEFNVQLPDDVLGRSAMRTVNGIVDMVLATESDGAETGDG